MHVWFNLKAGNAIGWLLDHCLRRKSILPDGSDSPEAVREQGEGGHQLEKQKDDIEVPGIKRIMNRKIPGTRLRAFLLYVSFAELLLFNIASASLHLTLAHLLTTYKAAVE